MQPRRLRSSEFPTRPHFRKRDRRLRTGPKPSRPISFCPGDSPLRSACVEFRITVLVHDPMVFAECLLDRFPACPILRETDNLECSNWRRLRISSGIGDKRATLSGNALVSLQLKANAHRDVLSVAITQSAFQTRGGICLVACSWPQRSFEFSVFAARQGLSRLHCLCNALAS